MTGSLLAVEALAVAFCVFLVCYSAQFEGENKKEANESFVSIVKKTLAGESFIAFFVVVLIAFKQTESTMSFSLVTAVLFQIAYCVFAVVYSAQQEVKTNEYVTICSSSLLSIIASLLAIILITALKLS